MIKLRLYLTGKDSLQIKVSRNLLISLPLNNTRPPTSTASAFPSLFFHMKESRYNFGSKFCNPAVLIKCTADNHYQPITSSLNDFTGQRKTFPLVGLDFLGLISNYFNLDAIFFFKFDLHSPCFLPPFPLSFVP